MANARPKPGETPEQARLRYNAEMRAYAAKRRAEAAAGGRPALRGSYDYARDKSSRLKKEYGIDLEQAQALLESQGCKCAICAKPLSMLQADKKAADFSHVDHCHTTGKVRGILCNNCNHGVGKFMDSPELLRKAATYLS